MIPHMEWNAVSECLEKCAPEPPPFVKVNVNVAEEHGSTHGSSNVKAKINAVADSGCQTTTAGIELLERLAINEQQLLGTRHGIVGILDMNLDIRGVLILDIYANGYHTKQLVYISGNSKGFFLSQRALKDLKMLPEDFPTAEMNPSKVMSTVTTCNDLKCSCPTRAKAPDRVAEIPFQPIAKNKEKLKNWIVTRYAASAFNRCTNQPLNEMSGEPMEIHFKEGATPYAVYTPIRVPVHQEKQVKEGLDKDERIGIIRKVPPNNPTDYCFRMVIQPKKNGDARRCVDYQPLAKVTQREPHHTPTPFSIVSTVPPNTYKTVLDCWNGYHSLPLAPESRDATTFITQWGRYQYLRAPQGYHASGDVYTQRFDEITKDFTNVSRCIDDSLLWDEDIESAFWRTCDYIKHCSDNGIVFNADKFVFAEETCLFAGFEITPEGYRPPQKLIDAIKNFPTPTCPTDIRSWFGLINQVAYTFAQAQIMAPFRELMTKRAMKDWYWDDALTDVFERSKNVIIDKIKDGVKAFEPGRTTCLTTDWSKNGIGFALLQKHCGCRDDNPACGDGHWKLVYAGSRFTKPAESRYAPIEGETLAVAYGLKQCKSFVMGCPNLIVAVDHKPLINILNNRALEKIENPRVLRLKEKTLMFDFKIVHVPGKLNCISDVMSRLPTQNAMIFEDTKEEEIEYAAKTYAVQISNELPIAVNWDDINTEAACDEVCSRLRDTIQCGFPEKRDDLPECIRKFWSMREELYVIGNTPFKERKMLVPASMRQLIIDGHHGVSSMKAAARERFFWPGLDADIIQKRNQCVECQQNAPSMPREKEILTDDPDLPFQQVAMDPCEIGGKSYLIYADRYTGWTEAALIKDKTFKTVKKELLKFFRTYGKPEEISIDGGPPFNGHEWTEFTKTWKIRIRQSSAYYAQSNGRAEVAVKVVKRILMDNIGKNGELETDKATKALMCHRNTPSQASGMSPAELLFGRKLSDHMPSVIEIRPELKTARESREFKYMTRSSKNIEREYKQLNVGDAVRVQNQKGNKPKKWSCTGQIMEVLPHRQYTVLMDGSNRLTTRNRRFLKKIPVADVTTSNQPRGISHDKPPPPIIQSRNTYPSLTVQQPKVTNPPRSIQQDVENSSTPTRPIAESENAENQSNDKPAVPTGTEQIEINSPNRTTEQVVENRRPMPMHASTPRVVSQFSGSNEDAVRSDLSQTFMPGDVTMRSPQQHSEVPKIPESIPDSAEPMAQRHKGMRKSTRTRKKPMRLIEEVE